MFKLTESFKEEYRAYIEEEVLEIDYEKSLLEFEQAQKVTQQSLNLMGEYFANFSQGLNEDMDDNSKKSDREVARTVDDIIGDKKGIYVPIVGAASIKRISQLSFPENVIFFFQQLIAWVVNLVKKFISFFTNSIRVLFGLDKGEDFVEEVKLTQRVAKQIESIAVPVFPRNTKAPEKASLLSIGMDQVETLISSGLGKFFMSESQNLTEDNEVKVVDINISKEIENIAQLLNYFLELFDNAYGSNREYLFGTEDLDLLLDLFKAATKTTLFGSPDFAASKIAIAGKLATDRNISASRLKDNLIRTKINTDNLKQVYVRIQEAFTNTVGSLSQKQLMALEKLGVNYRMYSASTYNQILAIAELLEPRYEQARKLEKDLQKSKNAFDKIVIDLAKERKALMVVSDVIYTDERQRRVNELFDASRYVNQTISLRLATLGLFIRQLTETKTMLKAINSLNKQALDDLRKELSKRR
jgi:hypothetical protein